MRHMSAAFRGRATWSISFRVALLACTSHDRQDAVITRVTRQIDQQRTCACKVSLARSLAPKTTAATARVHTSYLLGVHVTNSFNTTNKDTGQTKSPTSPPWAPGQTE